ncbi:helix-turn-helix domain-containing protein [Sinorhizobium medicae]|uniref:Helix-turn-helix domain-containing protein n=1 Tax=Sinorhizobium medicae TaxID=110321 RepID=A0A6G1WTQ9_9HYPH|nr:helix-turn-helix domain-containing protein [Sinorhizobium medicae]MQW72995.1 helix-turn-helix domain-containing protein [Sinorhizobium medicae]MQX86888.1 helix-turn-helix domain-containing protein [Sinorhizobium medicae]RVJ61826.1 IclR family transcriptional regulator [Sinorhizobium medicae]RVJ78554.1 IclR family transcriptional regulator [Sinorhizobium medicae]
MRYKNDVRLSHKGKSSVAVKERDLMGGLAKGLKVIEAFSAERPRLSIAETADIVGLDRATTRRCLLTLWELGYAAYDGKFFTVTPRVLRLGIGCLASLPIPRIVQPYLDALSEKIGQSSSVSILDETEIVYIARAAQRRVMSISLMPGSRLPAYCTSMGRVLLAALSEDEARSTLEKSALVARTEHTETDIERLLADIKETRERGYASIDQEVELGLVSVAVPLKAAGGRVVAAANIGMAASGRSMKEVIDHYLPPLLELQADLRQTLV